MTLTMEPGPSTFTISIEGAEQSVPCRSDDTLLCAILRAGVGVPYECNTGGCGSCKFMLLDGDVMEDREDAPGLSAGDRRRGKKLACISRARSDCAIRIRCDADYEAKIPPRRREVRLDSRAPLTHDLWEFRFLGTDAASFLPGQYAKFELPGMRSARSYSMSNITNDSGCWEFQIKRVPDGEATTLLFDRLEEGATILIDAPYSIAHLRESERRTVCIAGGSGLAPMVSILRGLGGTPGGAGGALLYYGARGPADVVPPDYFADIPGFDPGHQYRPVVSDPTSEWDGGWSGPVGLVHEFVAGNLSDDEAAEFYIAGPPPMVDAVRRHLVLERKIPVDRLHYDRFF